MKDEKMHIILFACEFYPVIGGAGTNSHNLASMLSRDGHEVHLLTYKFGKDNSGYDTNLPFRVHRINGGFPAKPFDWIFSFFSFVRILLKLYRSDTAILLNDWQSIIIFAQIRRIFHCKYYSFLLGSELNSAFENSRMLKVLVRGFYENCNGFIAISKYAKDLLIEKKTQIDKNKIAVIPPAVSFPSLKKIPSHRDEYRKRLNLSSDKFVLFQLSRVTKRKGHIYSIEALLEIPEDERKNILYLIGGSGPELNTLREKTSELGLDNCVKFVGRIPDGELPFYYDASDLYLMHSIETESGTCEGFGIVYIEAALRKKCSIGTMHGGISDAVINDYSGILIEEKNVKEISRAILNLKTNKTLKEKLDKNAYSRAIELFETNYVSQRIVEHIKYCRDL